MPGDAKNIRLNNSKFDLFIIFLGHFCIFAMDHRQKRKVHSNLQGTHCFLRHRGLASKTLPPKLKKVFDIYVKTIGMTVARTLWVRLHRLRTGVRHFRSCLHKWGTAPWRPVSLAQKNKPSAILSSNVQSIDLSMDCTA